jgi:hypothetical protein
VRELRGTSLRVLVLIILNSRLDGVLGKHAAVQLHRGKLKMSGNVGVLYIITQSHSYHC